jgi:hypothetical protein
VTGTSVRPPSFVIDDRAALRDAIRRPGTCSTRARCAAERQKRRIGCAPLGSQRGQHDVAHLFVIGEDGQERCVEAAALVAFGRAQEFVFEAEAVEEGPEARIVVGAVAVMRAERIGDRRERLAQMARNMSWLGTLPGHFAQAVHVVGKGNQPRLRPDMSSKARLTQVVRATSPKVPIWGRPDGP